MSDNSKLIKNKLAKANKVKTETISKMNSVEVKVQAKLENTKEAQTEVIKEKSKRGRKKATSSASVVIKNKKAIVSLSDVSIKKNKTFYLEDRYIQILDNLATRTGLSTSQLVQIAVDLLDSNLEIQGEK